MTAEWDINGNHPHNFEGELTPFQQRLYDQGIAEANLVKLLPERCRSCRVLSAFVLTHIVYELVAGDISKEEAIRRAQEHVQSCTGPEVDETKYDAPEICPVDPRPGKNRKPGLF